MTDIETQTAKAAVLVEALPYMQDFRGQTFLIKVGGSAMEDPELVKNLLRDVVFLEAVGVNPVLVHGGGKAISRAMETAGLAAKFIGGLRVTDAAAIGIVQDVLGKDLNPGIVDMLRQSGGKAAGLTGTHVFSGKRMAGEGGADLGFVGEVTGVDTDLVLSEITREVVPVVTPLAREEGTDAVLNVNADLAASALAIGLKASKLIYLSDVRGVMQDHTDESTLISTVDTKAFEDLSSSGVISGGMLPKVGSALDAISKGVGKVHLVDGRIPHSLLLEVFTTDGIGTQIVA